jgi:folate-binding protein YgfZ
MPVAKLEGYGLLRVQGADARAFLHAQLTSDVAALAVGRARRAGWCSAKGRLLATLLVIAREDDFLLQLARDLAAPVAKRLAMFVLRAKVRIADESEALAQHGVWGGDALARLGALGLQAPREELALSAAGGRLAVCLGAERYLVIGAPELGAGAGEEEWMLDDIRAGIPLVTLATQDQLVPQMANLERIGAVDFGKGCYPGQEVVARAQYRGAVKRRMYRVGSGAALRPGQDLYADDLPGQAAGTVLNAARGEALAVLPVASVEGASPVRAAAGGEPLAILPLPYAR